MKWPRRSALTGILLSAGIGACGADERFLSGSGDGGAFVGSSSGGVGTDSAIGGNGNQAGIGQGGAAGSAVDSGADARTDGGPDAATDAGDSASPDGAGLLGSCEQPLTGVGLVSGDTSAMPNDLDPTCASPQGSGNEIVYEITATENGRIELALQSSPDLGVSVRRDCRDATSEIGCADTRIGGEVLSTPVSSGQTVFVVVDGFSSTQSGAYTLDVTVKTAMCGDDALDGGEECDDGGIDPGDGCSGSCAVEACTTPRVLTDTINGDTTSSPSVMHTSCANSLSGPEDVYQFIAPTSGNYQFIVTPAGDTDFVLAVRPACADAALEECADAGFDADPETRDVSLTANESVFVIVEGWGVPDAGAYTLQVSSSG